MTIVTVSAFLLGLILVIFFSRRMIRERRAYLAARKERDELYDRATKNLEWMIEQFVQMKRERNHAAMHHDIADVVTHPERMN